MTNKEIREHIVALLKHCISNDIECIGGEVIVGKCNISFHFDYLCACNEEECHEKEKP